MEDELVIESRPDVSRPLLIIGFEGWANSGNVAIGMIDFLRKKLGATRFAGIRPDGFYRFDDVRPTVRFAGGCLEEFTPPEAAFFVAGKQEGRGDIVLFKAPEPHLRWFAFVENILSLCTELGVRLIISLGGFQDSVLHTDAVISGFASNEQLLRSLADLGIAPTEYEGPGAVHALIFQEAERMGIEGVSLWGHCPFYLQGTHLRLLCRMAPVLSSLGGFQVDAGELEKGWTQLARNIQRFIDGNPGLQKVIKELVKSKARVPGQARDPSKDQGKVIYLDDFFKPRG